MELSESDEDAHGTRTIFAGDAARLGLDVRNIVCLCITICYDIVMAENVEGCRSIDVVAGDAMRYLPEPDAT